MIIVREKRTECTVNQSCCQDLIVGSLSLSLCETSREAATGGIFFLVFYLQRHEINTWVRVFRGADGRQQYRIVHTNGDGAVGLFSQFPSLDGNGSSITQLDRLVNRIKHHLCIFFQSVKLVQM